MIFVIFTSLVLMPLSPKLEWKLKNRIVNIIIENDGEVFGGTARDKYLHDTHATLTYRDITENSENNALVNFDEKYNDAEFRPDLFGRQTIMNDIDATIHASKRDALIEKIKEEFPSIRKIFTRDPKEYFPALSIEPGQVDHERYIIDVTNTPAVFSLFNSTLMGRIKRDVPELEQAINAVFASIRTIKSIWIDLMVIKVPVFLFQNDPPFGNMDFECNSLIMNKTGFRVSSHLLTKRLITQSDIVGKANLLSKIMQDILKKNAVFIYNYNFPWYRIKKMKEKGWNLIDLLKNIEILNEKDYDGHCIICNDTIEGEMYKFKCCDARYHHHCIIQAFTSGTASMLDTNKCIMCRVDISDVQRDYRVISNMNRSSINTRFNRINEFP